MEAVVEGAEVIMMKFIHTVSFPFSVSGCLYGVRIPTYFRLSTPNICLERRTVQSFSERGGRLEPLLATKKPRTKG